MTLPVDGSNPVRVLRMPFHERVDVPSNSEIQRQSRTDAKRIVEVPRFEIVVIALQGLHRAPCAIVREAHQQVREAVSGIRSQEAPVADAVLSDVKAVVAVQPFHAGLHFVPAVDKADGVGKLQVADAHVFGALVRGRALESLIAGDPDGRPALLRHHGRILEALNPRHSVDVHARSHRAENKRRVVECRLRHVLNRRRQDTCPPHRVVLRLAVQIGRRAPPGSGFGLDS